MIHADRIPDGDIDETYMLRFHALAPMCSPGVHANGIIIPPRAEPIGRDGEWAIQTHINTVADRNAAWESFDNLCVSYHDTVCECLDLKGDVGT